MAAQRTYLAIDLKSFYASVECVDRHLDPCLLYTSPSPRDGATSRMPSSA